ncbi:MAG: hypothetical protein K9K88_18995 [Desulfobacterales bacterium]|nr:hypothetical protein [Desulfobacterales bacterium]
MDPPERRPNLSSWMYCPAVLTEAALTEQSPALGLALAFARFEIAITLSAINLIVLRFVGQIKQTINEDEK